MSRPRWKVPAPAALAAVLLAAALPGTSLAQMVVARDAEAAARAWVAMVLRDRGAWGGAEAASPGPAQALAHEGRQVGWLCPVQPHGFVAVPLRRELAPVKAYSEASNLDPAATVGPAELLKAVMGRVVAAAERVAGPLERIPPGELSKHLEIDGLPAWRRLEEGSLALPAPEKAATGGNYAAGEVMLASSWHQHEPYNDDCPDMGCPGTFNPNALVGCVATAGAQIMRYWAWPPHGVGSPYEDAYAWPSMFDRCDYDWLDRRWEDGTGLPITQAQIDAAAEISAEIGQAVGMLYTCDWSSANTDQMVGVYENQYRYHTNCDVLHRKDYTAPAWFALIQQQCNLNRPLQYRILGHSIVCDGWQQPTVAQYHMNYGWDDGHNAWYTLDELHYPSGGTLDDEYMVRAIFPACALGAGFSGTLGPPALPYRYFDLDAAGSSATFTAGQHLQFLPGIVVRCAAGLLRFESSGASPSRLFARGDLSRGARLQGGAIKMAAGAQVSLR